MPAKEKHGLQSEFRDLNDGGKFLIRAPKKRRKLQMQNKDRYKKYLEFVYTRHVNDTQGCK